MTCSAENSMVPNYPPANGSASPLRAEHTANTTCFCSTNRHPHWTQTQKSTHSNRFCTYRLEKQSYSSPTDSPPYTSSTKYCTLIMEDSTQQAPTSTSSKQIPSTHK